MTYLFLSLVVFAIVLASAFWWKWYADALSPPWRLYYLYHGFKARHQTLPSRTLQEENDIRRLMYLMPYVALSFTPVILIARKKHLLLSALSYVYWRILDTFDDLLVGEERDKGLRILHDRLQQLHLNGFVEDNDDEIDRLHFSNVGPRDEIYIAIVNTLERLDSIFLQMDEGHQDVLLRFVSYQTNAFLSVPRSHFKTERQYHEKCVLTIMSGLYLTTFEINRSLYKYRMDEDTKQLLEDACEAFETGNIIKDLEEDFRQGISYHPELAPRGIIQEIRSDEQEKIDEGREYLTYRGIRHLPSTCMMFRNEWNESGSTRLMALLLKTYLVKNYKKHWCKISGEPFGEVGTKRVFVGCLCRTLWDWETGIMELEKEMLSWRPNIDPLWRGGESDKG